MKGVSLVVVVSVVVAVTSILVSLVVGVSVPGAVTSISYWQLASHLLEAGVTGRSSVWQAASHVERVGGGGRGGGVLATTATSGLVDLEAVDFLGGEGVFPVTAAL